MFGRTRPAVGLAWNPGLSDPGWVKCRSHRRLSRTTEIPAVRKSGIRGVIGKAGPPDREIKPELAPQTGPWSPCGLEERTELELELRPIEKADENTKKMP